MGIYIGQVYTAGVIGFLAGFSILGTLPKAACTAKYGCFSKYWFHLDSVSVLHRKNTNPRRKDRRA